MKRLYFMRHGLSVMNQAGLFAGHTETPLSDEGRLQARAAGQRAKELSLHRIVASPYSRALETAQIIAEVIGYPLDEIEQNDLFIERNLGVLEGAPWDPTLDVDAYDGVESQDALFDRMRKAYAHLSAVPADNVLVVGHGASGRALRHIINPEFPFDGHAVKLPNGQIFQLV